MGFLESLKDGAGSAPAAAPAPPSGDKLDAAMRDAGIQAAPPPAAGRAMEKVLPDGRPAPTGEALISFVEAWVPVFVRAYSVLQKRVWDKELAAACRLSVEERGQLKLTADAAAPYVARLIEKSEALAAIAFGVQFSFILAGKFELVRSKPLRGALRIVPDDKEKEKESAPAHRRPVGRPPKR